MENIKITFQDVTKGDTKEGMSFTDDGIDKEGLAFSKGMVIASLLFYFLIVFIVLSMALDMVKKISTGVIDPTMNMSGLSALSAALGAIATGATVLPVTVCVNYYKKTSSGYFAKVEAGLFEKVLKFQERYNKNMMTHQHNLKLSDAEVSKIENQSKAKAITDGVFNDASSTIKTFMNDSTSLPKKETGA